MRILVVEDEPRIAADITRALEEAGYLTMIARDGETAWELGDVEPFDAAILDLGLPRLDGMSVLRRWREAGSRLPVVVLTARDSWREKVEGIDAGADDYLAKPFNMEELIARIRSVIRRAAGQAAPVLTAGTLSLDPRLRRVVVDGRVQSLSALEYRLLSYLLHHKGRIISQSELSEHIYESEDGHDSNALEVLIARLRRKLGIDVIETRRGHGYVIEGEEP